MAYFEYLKESMYLGYLRHLMNRRKLTKLAEMENSSIEFHIKHRIAPTFSHYHTLNSSLWKMVRGFHTIEMRRCQFAN